MSKGSHRIVSNSIYNLLGWLLPVIVNFLSIPIIVGMLGNDSYGILMLSTAVIGYFSVLDINMTAGSMKYVAEYYAKEDRERLNEVLTFSLVGYTIIGLVGAVILYFSVDLFLMDMLKIPEDLKKTANNVFHLVSVGFFLNIIQKYLLSIPKSIHRFDAAAKVEGGFGAALTIFTVVLLYMGGDLLDIIILRIVMLCLNTTTLYVIVKKMIPYSRFNSRIRMDIARKMIRFSGYSFLSKIAVTISNNSDRLVIGAYISSAAVTFYTVPFMLVARLMNISNRLSMVLFPVASEMDAMGNREDLEKIYIKMNRYIFFLNITMTAVLCLFSWRILQVWMGNDFADRTYTLMILISIAYFFDASTHLPSLVNDGLNFPQVTGFFSFARAAFGLVALIIGAVYYGLTGVASAYCITSVIFDIAFILYVHMNTIKIPIWTVINEACLKTFLFTLVIAATVLIMRTLFPTTKYIFLAETLFFVIPIAFFAFQYVLEDNMKSKLVGYFTNKINSK